MNPIDKVYPIIDRAYKAVKSCINLDQIEVARNYFNLAIKPLSNIEKLTERLNFRSLVFQKKMELRGDHLIRKDW